jgi:NAD(P)-dependent dehydrogenase (short-subunit alcohol dehydrogenase family)
MIARFPDLAGRVAVVTGASRGIGAGTAAFLAGNGMAVALVARSKDGLDEVRERIWDAGGRASVIPADVTDPEALAEIAAQIDAELGPVAFLAAFAGGAGAPKPSLEMSMDDWRHTLNADLTSTFATIRTFAPGMVARGYGSIVTMSSAAGRMPSRANVAYAAAKAGVQMLTRHLALELGPSGVRVNCIAPSAIHNERMDAFMTPDQLSDLGATFPLGRIGEPVDVAAATAFFAADASGWITGTTLDISGGKVIL